MASALADIEQVLASPEPLVSKRDEKSVLIDEWTQLQIELKRAA